MTRAERLIWPGLWALWLTAIMLAILGHLTGMRWTGAAMAGIIIAWPLALLLTLGGLRLLKRPQPAALARRRVLMPTARWLVLLALYGVLGWIVIAAVGRLIEADDPGKVAGGWALMGVYAAPGVLGLLVMIWFAAVHLRVRLAGREDFYRGLVHALSGRSAEAAEAFSRYHAAHPDDPRAWEGLALAMLANRRYEEALDAADRAIQLGRRAMGLWLRGHVFLAIGAGDEALSAFDACTRERPKPRLVGVFAGSALIQLRRLDDAIRTLQGEKGWRKIPPAAFALGEAYRLLGMSDVALTAYEAAARAADPQRDRALLACALAEAGRLREAAEAFEFALAADASDPLALHAQALIQRQRGDLPGLLLTIERMLEASPPAVVSALGDPELTSLLADERFRRLLGRAWQERDRILERVRSRPPP